MLNIFKSRPKIWLTILFLVLSIPLILPYLHIGYFPTDDGEWAVVRLTDMYRELKDLQFPARYSANLNFGYGYPLFEFAYPLPYYIGFVLHLFKLNFVNSIKLIFALTIPLSLWGMYLLAKEMWGKRLTAILTSIIYVFYPYRIVDLFVRGSIGESMAFALFPFIIYFLLKVHKFKSVSYVILASVFIAGLVMSHNIMALEFLPVILVFMLSSVWATVKNRLDLSIRYVFTLILGFGLSAFFWIPALSEKNLIALSVTPIADRGINYAHWWELLIPTWGYGIPPAPDQFTFQLGLPQIAVLLCLLLSLFIFKKQIAKNLLNDIFLTVIAFLFIFYLLLLFPFTNFIWLHTPLLREINYPWTLLGVMGFMIAILSSKLFVLDRFNYGFVTLAILTVIYIIPYAHPQTYVNRGDAFYLTNDATTTSSSEYMPLWVKQKPFQRPDIKFVALNSKAVLANQFYNSKKFSLKTSSTRPFLLQINIIYYPGWIAKVDGKATQIFYNNVHGVMRINVPSGHHVITGRLTETPLRLVSDLISLISIFYILVYLFRRVFSR